MNLSKSKYCKGIQCKKMLWLDKYKSGEATEVNNSSTFDNGTYVGEVAKDLFGNHTNITYNEDLNIMIKETKELLNKENIIITEASFLYENNFCSVDILKKIGNSYEIYEVKSSTSVKEIFYDDVSYQTYVLKKLGYNVVSSNIVYINSDYVKCGNIDLNKLFIIEDVTDRLKSLEEIEKNINEINIIKEEPNIDISKSCHDPYDCPYFKYCTRNLTTPNVFDIGWNVHFDKKIEMYKRNHISFKDVIENDKINDKAKEQILFQLENKKPLINKTNIKNLLNTFKYPLYFLDFESYQPCIPTIDGTKPYQQICFQYSLHYYLKENGKLYHKEFLSEEYNGNPMYGLCKKLCEDIPKDSCILVYNQTFEKARLKEMAELFPEFSEHLLNIRDNIIDLMIPFSKQDYYVKEMGGRWSIKVVLPALFPNDSSLDYHNLEQVHKGDEASNSYLLLPTLSEEEQKKLRKNMLKYCELDTYAMVKILEKLESIIKSN